MQKKICQEGEVPPCVQRSWKKIFFHLFFKRKDLHQSFRTKSSHLLTTNIFKLFLWVSTNISLRPLFQFPFKKNNDLSKSIKTLSVKTAPNLKHWFTSQSVSSWTYFVGTSPNSGKGSACVLIAKKVSVSSNDGKNNETIFLREGIKVIPGQYWLFTNLLC